MASLVTDFLLFVNDSSTSQEENMKEESIENIESIRISFHDGFTGKEHLLEIQNGKAVIRFEDYSQLDIDHPIYDRVALEAIARAYELGISVGKTEGRVEERSRIKDLLGL